MLNALIRLILYPLLLLWDTICFYTVSREFIRTGSVADMQKFLAVYKLERDGILWGHTFCKSKKEALDRCQTKAGKGKISTVWICQWRDLKALPEHIHGSKEGEYIAISIVAETRGNAGIKEQDKKKPVIESKPKVKMKPQKSEEPSYTPPYEIKVADGK